MAGAFRNVDRFGELSQRQRPLVHLECFENVDDPLDRRYRDSAHRFVSPFAGSCVQPAEQTASHLANCSIQSPFVRHAEFGFLFVNKSDTSIDSNTNRRQNGVQTGNEIIVEMRVDGALWITIDRAHKHNALARHVLSAIARAVDDAAARVDLRCIVLTGAGDRFFAAGGDLRDLSGVRDADATLAMSEQARGALDALRHCPVPVIAMLNGDAIGGGAELALACDMRMQAAHARIGFVQARLAITSAWGGGPDLCRTVGGARAMRMMSRCEMVDAACALSWGLADAVIADGPHGADVRDFLAPLLACAPQVLRGIKAQVIAWREGASGDAARRVEQQQLLTTWLHDDHWRASDTFLDKGTK
ncbi:enoyl-CoA hydratase/isomerase family protein [Burkholderia sp. PU8-34]